MIYHTKSCCIFVFPPRRIIEGSPGPFQMNSFLYFHFTSVLMNSQQALAAKKNAFFEDMDRILENEEFVSLDDL